MSSLSRRYFVKQTFGASLTVATAAPSAWALHETPRIKSVVRRDDTSIRYGGVNLSGGAGAVLGPDTLEDYLLKQSVVRPVA